MVLGIIVVLIVGNFIVNYIKAKKVDSLPAINTEISQEQQVHKVVKGESLWVLAEKYYGDGFKWEELAKENNLTEYSLEIGQELKVPANDEFAQADNTIASDTYTVVHGDTLWNIAVRTYGDGYKWLKIAEANNLTHPDFIHSGNVLTLPK